ncbi:MAG: hypothetical protein L0Y75_02080 [Acidobacteria bacterium]|nr:hypothetical protein [Acidobacteriota bacterium]
MTSNETPCARFYFATTLTSRFETTMVLTIYLLSSFAFTRSLASAASFIVSSETPDPCVPDEAEG